MAWWAHRWIFHWRQCSGLLMQPLSYVSRSGHFTCKNGAKCPHVSSASPAEGREPLQTEGRLSSYHNDLKGADLLPSCHVEIYLHSNFNSSLCCWKRQGEDTGKLCWEVILRGHQVHLSTDYCWRKGHLAFRSTWATFGNISAFCICGSKVGARFSYSNGYVDYLPQILPCNINSVTHNYRLLGKTASNMGSCVCSFIFTTGKTAISTQQ